MPNLEKIFENLFNVIYNKDMADNNFINLKRVEVYRILKELYKGRPEQKKADGVRYKLTKEDMIQKINNFIPAPKKQREYDIIRKKAKELGFTQPRPTKQQIKTFLTEKITISLKYSYCRNPIKIDKVEINQLHNFVVDPVYTGDHIYKQLPDTTILNRVNKETLFNTTRQTVKEDIKTFLDRHLFIYDPEYYITFNVTYTIAQNYQSVYTPLTVPLKIQGAPDIHIFNEKNEIILTNNNQTNTCVIDLLYKNYVMKYSYHYTKSKQCNFPYLTKEQIAQDIKEAYDENERIDNLITDDFEPTQYNPINDGVSILQLELFCKKYGISLRCLTMDCFMFYSYTPIKPRKVSTLMLVIENGHCYDITDTMTREQVQRMGRNIHVNVLENERDKKENDKKKIIRNSIIKNDIQFHTFLNTTNTDYYTVNEINELYLDYWRHQNIFYKFQQHAKVITKISLENGNNIFYNPEVEEVMGLCEMLGIEFKNQSIVSMGSYLYKNTTDKDLTSCYSQFNNNAYEFVKAINRDNWVHTYNKPDENDEIGCLDINKCYSSILKRTSDYLQFNTLDEVEVYNGEDLQKDTLYYVDTDCTMLIVGSGVYFYEIVKQALTDNLISKTDIKYKLTGKIIEINELKHFTDTVYNTCGDYSKQIINTFIGSKMGKHCKTLGKVKYTDEINTACCSFYNKTASVFVKEERADGKKLYECEDIQVKPLNKHSFILQSQIVQLGYLEVYKMIKKQNGTLLSVRVDCIDFIKTTDYIGLGDRMGEYKIAQPNEKYKKTEIRHRPYKYINKEFVPITINDEFDMSEIIDKTQDKDILLMGSAGTGKSYVLKELKKHLTDKKINIKYAAFTNMASKNIDGCTLHKLFGLDINGVQSHTASFDGIDYVVIDEVSMMPSIFYDAIINIKRQYQHIKFILCGDFNQLSPVGEESIDFKNSSILKDICINRLELTVNKRVEGDGTLLFQVLKDSMTGIRHHFIRDTSDIKLNLSYYNRTRKTINNNLMNKYKGDTYTTYELTDELTNHKNYNRAQTIQLYEGLPMIAKVNNEDFVNGEMFNIKSFTNTEILTDHDKTIKITKDFICDFYPAYCLTVHQSQGMTIRQPYMIYDIEKYDPKMLYTALSRTSKREYIHINENF